MVNGHILKGKVCFATVAQTFLLSVWGMLVCPVVWQVHTTFWYVVSTDNLTKKTTSYSNRVRTNSICLLGYINAYPLPTQLFSCYASCRTPPERIKDNITLVGRGSDNAV